MRSQAQKPRQDIYETITSKLLAAIEASPGARAIFAAAAKAQEAVTYLDGFQATTAHRSVA